MLKLRSFATLLLALAICTAQAQDKRLMGIDTAIQRILTEFHVPGAIVTVVEKDRIILAEGYGYKDFENKKKATPNTLFQIASCSKAFTSAILGTLEGEKLLDLDKPVNGYMPELRFKDPYLTAHVTTRDMMTHRTGLPRHDMAWYLRGSNTNRAEMVKVIEEFEASAGLRETWQYNNFMFMAQGALAEKLTGKTWEMLLEERIFKPLGMKNAQHSAKGILANKDYALPYSYNEDKDKLKKLDIYQFYGMEPAGSIAANAIDMGQWLRLWVNSGKYAGKEILPLSYYQEAIKNQMAMTNATNNATLNTYTYGYGFGWMIKSYKGHAQVEHGGNIDGFSSTTCFFPADSIGIFVSVNQNGSVAQGNIRNWIADRLLNVEKTDWTSYLQGKKKDAKKEEKEEAAKEDLGQKKGTSPSHAPNDYLGKYDNTGYGSLIVYQGDKGPMAIFGKDTAFLEHYHYDVFKLKSTHLEDTDEDTGIKFRFLTNFDGEISGLDGQFEPALKNPILFKKEPKTVAVAETTLQMYIGTYQIQGADVTIALKNGTLRMTVPGQPEYELIPSKEHEFRLKDLEGFNAKFEVKDGKVTAMYSIQPNGTFKMERK
jgi:CubicO group peptidase (beta-lactamase class C family)